MSFGERPDTRPDRFSSLASGRPGARQSAPALSTIALALATVVACGGDGDGGSAAPGETGAGGTKAAETAVRTVDSCPEQTTALADVQEASI